MSIADSQRIKELAARVEALERLMDLIGLLDGRVTALEAKPETLRLKAKP